MTNEQFMAILEMVGTAGNGAFFLAVLYLLKGYFTTIVWATVFGGLLYGGFRLISMGIDYHRIVERVAKASNTSTPVYAYGARAIHKLLDKVLDDV